MRFPDVTNKVRFGIAFTLPFRRAQWLAGFCPKKISCLRRNFGIPIDNLAKKPSPAGMTFPMNQTEFAMHPETHPPSRPGFRRAASPTAAKFLAHLAIALLVVVSGFFAPVSLHAADRVALVIGGDKYDHLPASGQLAVAVRDAELLSDTLTGLSPAFQVTTLKNPTREACSIALSKFTRDARDAECALIYFAGHGIEYFGENYLLCRDTEVESQDDSVQRMKERLYYQALPLRKIIEDLGDTGANLKLVILDACRDNPLEAQTAGGTRAVVGSKGGLGRVTAPSGMLISYSADAGQQANDGLFTPVFAETLKKPGLSIMQVFAQTRTQVRERSTEMQRTGRGVLHEPAEYSKLEPGGLNFAFLPGQGGSTVMSFPSRVTAVDRLRAATVNQPFVNSLGMEFVPVPGKPDVYLCRTETRVRDFRAYAENVGLGDQGGSNTMEVIKNDDGTHTIEWQLISDAGWDNPGFPQTDDHPVVCVNWERAREFCEWLSAQEPGLTYRLPKDTEWSAAVGSLGKYPWGNEWPPPDGVGNYPGEEKNEALPGTGWSTVYDRNDGFWNTAPVANFKMNRFGFFDLGGNVKEWCEDEYLATMNSADTLQEIPSLEREISSDGVTHMRVVRGCGWSSYTEIFIRSAARDRDHPRSSRDDTGFRVAVEPSNP